MLIEQYLGYKHLNMTDLQKIEEIIASDYTKKFYIMIEEECKRYQDMFDQKNKELYECKELIKKQQIKIHDLQRMYDQKSQKCDNLDIEVCGLSTQLHEMSKAKNKPLVSSWNKCLINNKLAPGTTVRIDGSGATIMRRS